MTPLWKENKAPGMGSSQEQSKEYNLEVDQDLRLQSTIAVLSPESLHTVPHKGDQVLQYLPTRKPNQKNQRKSPQKINNSIV